MQLNHDLLKEFGKWAEPVLRQKALNILVNRAKRIALNSCVGESAMESVA